METPDHIDGEQRRAKRRLWWKLVFRPQTLKVLLAVLPLLTKLVQLGIVVSKIFRE
ncbi:MAG TPA: hypothetical protein VGH40_03820 [Roseiarcus sp.]